MTKTRSRLIVGLSGRAGSGKSTAAKELIENYGFVRHRFADPLKRMLKQLGLNDDEIEGAYKEKPCHKLGGKSPRHAMKTLGTEWGRDLIDPHLWVRAWYLSLPPGKDIVVDDVRFDNEVVAIHGLGGKIVEIKRSGQDQSDDHVSERGVQADIVIENDGSREDLSSRLNEALVE